MEFDWKPAVWRCEANPTPSNTHAFGNHFCLIVDAANVLQHRGGVHQIESPITKREVQCIAFNITNARVKSLDERSVL